MFCVTQEKILSCLAFFFSFFFLRIINEFAFIGYDDATDLACLESQGQVVHFGEGISGRVAETMETVAIANAYEVSGT